jgi:putative component of membrane protein insertase Oxa1/YidC/SpoIIIJ protein YidD
MNRPANAITVRDARATSTYSRSWSNAPGRRCAPTATCAQYYRHQVRRFGGLRSPAAKNKAIVAVAHKLIVIIWHALATGRPYQDLGADYFTTRIDPEKERRRLIAKLEAQGFKVTLEPAA